MGLSVNGLPSGTPSRSSEVRVSAVADKPLPYVPEGSDGVLEDVSSRWVSMSEAAVLAGVTKRTVRRWVSAGQVESRLEEDDGHQVRWIRADTLPTDREDIPEDRVRLALPDAGEDSLGDDREDRGRTDREDVPSDMLAVLRARLDGAHLAAKLQSQRFREARHQVEAERELRFEERTRGERAVQEERARLSAVEERAKEQAAGAAAEIEFLRQQLQQRTDAERELRILLAQTTKALQMVNETPALVAEGRRLEAGKRSDSGGHASATPRLKWWNPATWRCR